MSYETGNPRRGLFGNGRHSRNRTSRATVRLSAAVRPCLEPMEPRQLLSAGDLDSSFGSSGVANVDIATPSSSFGQALALQSDGKILVAGSVTDFANYDFSLARYNADGTLDSTFGAGGVVSTSFGSTFAVAKAVAVDSLGRIVVAGYAQDADVNTTNDFAIARYNSDGTLDDSFDGDGKVTTDFDNGSDDLGYGLAIHAGKIVVVGSINSSDFAVARYNDDGSLDTSFDVDGTLTTDFDGGPDGANAVAVQSDGSIIAAGFATVGGNPDLALARYNSDGSLDTGFSGDGLANVDFGGLEDQAYAVAVDSDGKLVVAGTSQDSGSGASTFALARFTTGGGLDGTFGSGGTVTTDFASSGDLDVARSIAVATDGKLVVAGYNVDPFGDGTGAIALARYDTNGGLDAGFGAGGQVTTPSTAVFMEGVGVGIQGDGKIVAAGSAFNGTNFNFAVARYDGDPVGPGNTAPTANAGGPYAIVEGGSLSLSAAASTDPDFDPLTFSWDLDDDGSFDDATGVSPTISWSQLQSLLASDDGNGSASFTVKVRADDGQAFNDAMAVVSLGNTAPTATLAGGAAVGLYSASSVNFSGAADPSTVDTNAGFTYSYDFNNDGDFSDAGDVSGSSSTSASFTYSAPGTYTVRGRVADKDGGFTDYTTTVTVQTPATASVIPDPINPTTNSALLIWGSEQWDIIVVAINGQGAIQGSFTGTIQFGGLLPLPGKPFGRVIIYSRGGNDTIVMASLNVPAVVFAGAGNDSVLTGQGNDILIGGDGNDRLYSGQGNDLTIGGKGADILRGDAGNDALISGNTDYDDDLFSLTQISSGAIPLSTSFMHDDAAQDTLTGNQGIDRFFANQSDGVINDIVTDQNGSEAWEDLV